MEKLKRKPLSSPVSVKAVRWNGWGLFYSGKDLRKRYLLSLEWKRVGVMDNDSGGDGRWDRSQMSLDNSVQSVEKSEKKNDQD